jgi:hypothetical protein
MPGAPSSAPEPRALTTSDLLDEVLDRPAHEQNDAIAFARLLKSSGGVDGNATASLQALVTQLLATDTPVDNDYKRGASQRLNARIANPAPAANSAKLDETILASLGTAQEAASETAQLAPVVGVMESARERAQAILGSDAPLDGKLSDLSDALGDIFGNEMAATTLAQASLSPIKMPLALQTAAIRDALAQAGHTDTPKRRGPGRSPKAPKERKTSRRGPGRPRKKPTAPEGPKPERVDAYESTLNTLIDRWNQNHPDQLIDPAAVVSISKSGQKGENAVPAQLLDSLKFAMFKLVDSKGGTPESRMDNEMERLAARAALRRVFSNEAVTDRACGSFFAHVKDSFRDKIEAGWESRIIPELLEVTEA